MLIVFEGADGTGKSTAAKWLVEVMKANIASEMSVAYTREPTDSVFGKAIRDGWSHAPVVEAALFMADRIRHVREVIKPASIAAKQHLIMDRYFYSMAAYQSAREHPDLKASELLADARLFCPEPTIMFLFECDVDVARNRIAARGRIDCAFEMTDYQKRVKQAFRDIVPSTTQLIDTTAKDIDAVKKEVLNAVRSRSAHLDLMLKNVV